MITKDLAAIEKLAVSRERIRCALLPAAAEPTNTTGNSTVSAIIQGVLTPYAQSNPFVLVAGAFVAGGLLASNRHSVNALATVLVKEALPRFAPALTAAISTPDWTDILGAVLQSGGASRS
jgi:NADPH-dependent 2,4-dienoyl-CoA reductase/sulfur reductase-like enzyme